MGVAGNGLEADVGDGSAVGEVEVEQVGAARSDRNDALVSYAFTPAVACAGKERDWWVASHR